LRAVALTFDPIPDPTRAQLLDRLTGEWGRIAKEFPGEELSEKQNPTFLLVTPSAGS
jgi:hypothetical protein